MITIIRIFQVHLRPTVICIIIMVLYLKKYIYITNNNRKTNHRVGVIFLAKVTVTVVATTSFTTFRGLTELTVDHNCHTSL